MAYTNTVCIEMSSFGLDHIYNLALSPLVLSWNRTGPSTMHPSHGNYTIYTYYIYRKKLILFVYCDNNSFYYSNCYNYLYLLLFMTLYLQKQ